MLSRAASSHVHVLARVLGTADVADTAALQRLPQQPVDAVRRRRAGAVQAAVAQDRIVQAELPPVLLDVGLAGLFAAPVEAAGTAVDVHRAGEHEALDAGLPGGLQCPDRAEHVVACRRDRVAAGLLQIGQGSQVKDAVAACGGGGQRFGVEQVADHHLLSRPQVDRLRTIEDRHLEALFAQGVDDVAAEKAGAAGDQSARHQPSSPANAASRASAASISMRTRVSRAYEPMWGDSSTWGSSRRRPLIGLLGEDIQVRPGQPTGGQKIVQGGLVHQAAARGVDQDGLRLELRQLRARRAAAPASLGGPRWRLTMSDSASSRSRSTKRIPWRSANHSSGTGSTARIRQANGISSSTSRLPTRPRPTRPTVRPRSRRPIGLCQTPWRSPRSAAGRWRSRPEHAGQGQLGHRLGGRIRRPAHRRCGALRPPPGRRCPCRCRSARWRRARSPPTGSPGPASRCRRRVRRPPSSRAIVSARSSRRPCGFSRTS